MPTGLFDIETRSLVLSPGEISATAQRAMAICGPEAAEGINAAAQTEVEKWNRAVATADLIDLIKAGKAVIGPRFAQPPVKP